MGVGGQRHAPAAIPSGKRAGTYFIGGWVGTMAGLDGCRKILPPPGFDPRTFQSVVSCTVTICVLWGLFPQHFFFGLGSSYAFAPGSTAASVADCTIPRFLNIPPLSARCFSRPQPAVAP